MKRFDLVLHITRTYTIQGMEANSERDINALIVEAIETQESDSLDISADSIMVTDSTFEVEEVEEWEPVEREPQYDDFESEDGYAPFED